MRCITSAPPSWTPNSNELNLGGCPDSWPQFADRPRCRWRIPASDTPSLPTWLPGEILPRQPCHSALVGIAWPSLESYQLQPVDTRHRICKARAAREWAKA